MTNSTARAISAVSLFLFKEMDHWQSAKNADEESETAGVTFKMGLPMQTSSMSLLGSWYAVMLPKFTRMSAECNRLSALSWSTSP